MPIRDLAAHYLIFHFSDILGVHADLSLHNDQVTVIFRWDFKWFIIILLVKQCIRTMYEINSNLKSHDPIKKTARDCQSMAMQCHTGDAIWLIMRAARTNSSSAASILEFLEFMDLASSERKPSLMLHSWMCDAAKWWTFHESNFLRAWGPTYPLDILWMPPQIR